MKRRVGLVQALLHEPDFLIVDEPTTGLDPVSYTHLDVYKRQVEPMINIGTPDVLWLDDEWTVITADMSLSAHYENTIIITAVSYTHLDVYKRQG